MNSGKEVLCDLLEAGKQRKGRTNQVVSYRDKGETEGLDL